MVFLECLINIFDKSGVLKVKYISGIFYKKPGFLIKGVCFKLNNNKNFNKGLKVSVFIISTNIQYNRHHRIFKTFLYKGIIVDKTGNPISKLVCNIFCKTLRRRKFFKIISISKSSIV